MIQAYRASLSWVDWNVGRVLAKLDELHLRQNTIIVFWGDHGYHLGEKGKWSKHTSLFETGARVPLMIALPTGSKIGKPGSVARQPVQTLDLYPTLAALCGLKTTSPISGHSLKPLIENPQTDWSHPAYTVAGTADRLHKTVRIDGWRYTEWSGPDGGAALIDEQNDPHELQRCESASACGNGAASEGRVGEVKMMVASSRQRVARWVRAKLYSCTVCRR